MSVHKLLDPILDQGLLHTNFFEGRLLSAQDLRDQQDANRERGRRLGRALGSGIVDGLEVVLESDGADGQPPVVTVKAGLAINAEGEIIGLPKHDVQVALARSIVASPTTEADFYACAGPPTTKHLPNGVGVYVLVMSPAAGYKDRAPMSGLGDAGVVKGCGSRYVQEGVRFRLVEFVLDRIENVSVGTQEFINDALLSPSSPVQKTEISRLSTLQNVLAHLCFGTEQRAQIAADPLNETGAITLGRELDALEQLQALAQLENCDMPLALLYWTLDGIAILDNWAVRRRLHRQSSFILSILKRQGSYLPRVEAQLMQFQEQLGALLENHPTPASVKAAEYFRFLPPAGLLPLATSGVGSGFTTDNFFHGLTCRMPAFMEGAHLDSLLLQALQYPAISTESKALIWLYRIRENVQLTASEEVRPREMMLFAIGHMPFVGHARFDLARWNYANYLSALFGPAEI